MRKQDSRNSLLRDERGVVAVIVAIMLPVFIGFAALAIDMSYARWTRTELQHTASAAALAGVLDLTDKLDPASVPDTDDYRKKAVEYAYKNMSQARHGRILQPSCGTYVTVIGTVKGSKECADVKAGNWNPATRTFTAWDEPFNPLTNPNGFDPATMELDAVKVYTHRSQGNGNPLNLFLAAVVGLAQINVNTYAVAWAEGINRGFVCLLALHDGSRAMVYEGDETLVLPSCAIQVNSADPNAVEISPTSPEVTVASYCITGGIVGPTEGMSPPPKTGNADCPPVPDPFASVDEPVVGPCTENDFNVTGGVPTLYPGVYCGGLNINNFANVTFSPGTYIIKDGTFNVDGTSSVTGDGVTFFLTGDNTTFVNFNEDTQVDLSAPTEGPLFGLVFFGAREGNVAPNLTNNIGSNAHMSIEGTAYFPNGKIKIISRIGGGETTSPYTTMIAQKFRFATDAAMHVNSGSGSPFDPAVYSRLVD